MTGYKVFTHDLCSPIQRGPPIWDGAVPYTLPVVPLDTGPGECAAGWNFARDLANALLFGGLFPTGRPSRAYRVEGDETSIQRGGKCRAASGIVLEAVGEAEIGEAVLALSWPFGVHQVRMAESQMAWRAALNRSFPQLAAIPDFLAFALEIRGLNWTLKQYNTVEDARIAGNAWAAGARDVRTTWAAALDNVRAAGPAADAWPAWDAWAAWDNWPAEAAAKALRAAWDAWQVAGNSWNAWAARDGLVQEFASLSGLILTRPDLLTTGLREAYQAGLEIALSTGERELGWSATP